MKLRSRQQHIISKSQRARRGRAELKRLRKSGFQNWCKQQFDQEPTVSVWDVQQNGFYFKFFELTQQGRDLPHYSLIAWLEQHFKQKVKKVFVAKKQSYKAPEKYFWEGIVILPQEANINYLSFRPLKWSIRKPFASFVFNEVEDIQYINTHRNGNIIESWEFTRETGCLDKTSQSTAASSLAPGKQEQDRQISCKQMPMLWQLKSSPTDVIDAQQMQVQQPFAQQQVILPSQLQSSLFDVLLYTRDKDGNTVAYPLLPERKHISDGMIMQHMITFSKEQNGSLEKYLKALIKIIQRQQLLQLPSQQINHQIDLTTRLLGGLLGNPRHLGLPVSLLYIPQQENIKSLGEKFKVLYSKGRKKMHERQQFAGVLNSLQKCFVVIKHHREIEMKKHERRANSQAVLQAISSHFHIVNQATLRFIKYHTLPVDFDYGQFAERHQYFKFYVSFYAESLLVQRGYPPTPFPSWLIYCPIMWDTINEKYFISNHYLNLLEQQYHNWQQQVLCVDVVHYRQAEDETIYVSYLHRTHNAKKLLGMLSIIRDKIYQFMIFEFLKVLFECQSNEIKVPLAKNITMRIYLTKRQQLTQSKFITELMIMLMINLRPQRRSMMDRAALKKKIKTKTQEMFVDRYSADKLSEEIHILRRDEQLPLQFRKNDKSKVDVRDIYKSIDNQRM